MSGHFSRVTRCDITRLSLLCTVLLILPAFPGSSLRAQGQRAGAVTLTDYYRFESVGAPAISPDGRYVAYVRTRILEEENRSHSEIWLRNADGSNTASRLTSTAEEAARAREVHQIPRFLPRGLDPLAHGALYPLSARVVATVFEGEAQDLIGEP